MSGTASETLTMLRLMLDASDEFVSAHASLPNAPAFNIVYQGVSLQLAVHAQIAKFTDLKKLFCNLDSCSVLSGIHIGLGEHVAGGERVPAIVKALLGAAAKLGLSLGAVATVWHPAQIVSGFDYFSDSVACYLAGGAFPVLAMVNSRIEASGKISSTGLDFLAGRELQITGSDTNESDRICRFVQAAHALATDEPIQSAA